MTKWFRTASDWQFVLLHAIVVISMQYIGFEHFRFDNKWLASGEIWRVISAHWSHVGWFHLLLNLMGLVICVGLTRPNWSLKRWLISCLAIALGISVLLTLLNRELIWYAGFSGVLFGLYLLTAQDLYQRDRLVAILIIAIVLFKVVLEQFSSFDIDSADLIGAPVVVDAHLYGVLIAMVIAIALIWSRYTMNHGSTEHSN